MLLNAFTRALKVLLCGMSLQPYVLKGTLLDCVQDPFAPARTAGLLALSATMEYYDAPEIATRVLPSIAAMAIDQEKVGTCS